VRSKEESSHCAERKGISISENRNTWYHVLGIEGDFSVLMEKSPVILCWVGVFLCAKGGIPWVSLGFQRLISDSSMMGGGFLCVFIGIILSHRIVPSPYLPLPRSVCGTLWGPRGFLLIFKGIPVIFLEFSRNMEDGYSLV